MQIVKISEKGFFCNGTNFVHLGLKLECSELGINSIIEHNDTDCSDALRS